MEARKLRNQLVHEYMEDPDDFAKNLLLAKDYTRLLIDCFNDLLDFARQRMDIKSSLLPEKLMLLE